MTKIEIAPMLDLTDRHFRYFLRLICRQATFYTEMIAEQAILNGDKEKLLSFDDKELPLVLQIGGSHPEMMAIGAKTAEEFGYTEVNINAGCPSSRVLAGTFGACLMDTPEKVAQCVRAMKNATTLPVTVKTRIALETANDSDDLGRLLTFVDINADAGVHKFIIHARKARLKGYSPKDNRSKMPLYYETVYRLKEKRPDLEILINGDICSIDDINRHAPHVDGVMIGRAAYTNPYFLAETDALFYNDARPVLLRKEIGFQMLEYIQKQPILSQKHIFRHLMGLYHGTPVAKQWKKALMSKNLNEIGQFLSDCLF